MRILILGAGKMGSFFNDLLSFEHETAIYDVDPQKLKFTYHTYRFTSLKEIEFFKPDLVINAVTLKYTITAFKEIISLLPSNCILSDIASIKTDLELFYRNSGFRFVSTHPMFGPTFATLSNLNKENAIIISESDTDGKAFFYKLYENLDLNITEYSFEKHDHTALYSLATPFISTFIFSAAMKPQKAPGTTFKKHLAIAKGVLAEDIYLLQEILFNSKSAQQIESIISNLKELQTIINKKDSKAISAYINSLKKNIN